MYGLFWAEGPSTARCIIIILKNEKECIIKRCLLNKKWFTKCLDR